MEQSRQRCWACGATNVLPLADGRPAPLFKCGWCAALNSGAGGSASDTASPGAPRLLLDQPRPCRRPALPLVAGRTLIAVVLLMVGSIFVLGLSLVLPALFSPTALATLHLPLAVLLMFNILFNYGACILRPAGPVRQHLHHTALDAGGWVRHGALAGCRYCEQCCYYKPAQAHHCRSCGCCVLRMDHHCWYINNCCGAANLRAFLLFLLYLVAATAYGLALGVAMGWKDRRLLMWHTQHVIQFTASMSPALRLLAFQLYWLMSAPHWLACWAYFTGVCFVTVFSVSLLLARQVRLLLQGRSYLDARASRQALRQHQQQCEAAAQVAELVLPDGITPPQPTAGRAGSGGASLAAPSSAVGTSAAMRNMRHVFGSGHPLTWLLPAWDVAPPAEVPICPEKKAT